MMTDEDPTETPSRPLPHFEVLKEEAEQENVRVREFMKGSFTYKVEERETAKVQYSSGTENVPLYSYQLSWFCNSF